MISFLVIFALFAIVFAFLSFFSLFLFFEPPCFPSHPVGILFTLFPLFYTSSARIYTRLRVTISHTRLMLMHAHINAHWRRSSFNIIPASCDLIFTRLLHEITTLRFLLLPSTLPSSSEIFLLPNSGTRRIRSEGCQRRNRADLPDDQARIWRAVVVRVRNSRGKGPRGCGCM